MWVGHETTINGADLFSKNVKMAEKQIQLYKKGLINMATQTGADEDYFKVHLDRKKVARIYYSSAYKDMVLSLNFGSSKNFIFTKSMWKLFRNYTATIDNYLNND